MRQALRHVVGGLCVVLLTAGIAWAQAGATAQINGTVRDTSGGVLPGVDVTVTQTDTNFTRSAVTDAEGNYVLSNLPIGPYRLQATLSGFRTFQRTGIVLQVNANPTIFIELAVGELAETVSVEAADAARRDAQSRRRSGHRERANRGTAAQRPQRRRT